MTLRGQPFLISKGSFSEKEGKSTGLCGIFGISKWTLRERLDAGVYKLLVWVDDNGTKKATRPSVEAQLKAMKVGL